MADEQGVPSAATPFTMDSPIKGGITPPWYRFLISLWKRTGGGTGDGGSVLVQPGTPLPWPGAAIPAGYLECNGVAVSRTTFADLFLAIGTTWGVGDGSTTFNLPDFRGRTLFGANGTSVIFGAYGGAASVSLSAGQMPSHNHGINDPGHTHGTAEGPIVDVSPGSGYGVLGAGGNPTGSSGTGISTQNAGSGDPIAILPPFAGVKYIIKT